MAASADDEDEQKRSTVVVHESCIHSNIVRDVAAKGYRYECQMADDGSFGLATHVTTGYHVCIVQRRTDASTEVHGELDHWKWLSSAHCMRLYEHFTAGRFHYFVTEPVVSGNVLVAFESLTKDDDPQIVTNLTRAAGHNLLSALRDVHAAGFLHLNVTWSQVWIDAYDRLRLGGFQNLTPAIGSSSRIACIDYPSPEMLEGGPVTDKADVWAAGVAILQLLTHRWTTPPKLYAKDLTPPRLKFLQDIREYLPNLKRRLRDHRVDSVAVDFLVKLLKFEASKRPTAAEALRHTWFRSLGCDSKPVLPLSNVREKVAASTGSTSSSCPDVSSKHRSVGHKRGPVPSMAAVVCFCGITSARSAKDRIDTFTAEKGYPERAVDVHKNMSDSTYSMASSTMYADDNEAVEWPRRSPKAHSHHEQPSVSKVTSSSSSSTLSSSSTAKKEPVVPDECRTPGSPAVRAVLKSRERNVAAKRKDQEDQVPMSTTTESSSSSTTLGPSSSEEAQAQTKLKSVASSTHRCHRRHPGNDVGLVKCHGCRKVIHPC